jgi:AraC-like DNA-binding protein
MAGKPDDNSVTVAVTNDGQAAMVRVDALRRFAECVRELGGDPDAIFESVQFDPAALENRLAMIPYRTMVQLLERASIELDCKDFGMRLAEFQAQTKAMGGPLEIVMRNSQTLGDALRYSTEHVQAYSDATQLFLDRDRRRKMAFLRLEILVSRVPYRRQGTEHALLQVQQNVLNLTSGRVRPKEVWFAHEPLASPATYRANFGCPVLFGKSVTGLHFAESDLDVEIQDTDPQLYEMATTYIAYRYPAKEPFLSARVRTLVERQLAEGECTFVSVASSIGMHPRTLQRRLRAEGESFEAIKDGVRRDVALRYLKQSDLPLIRVAELLGYSETSVLSRSCYRWFSASPRQLRLGKADPIDN